MFNAGYMVNVSTIDKDNKITTVTFEGLRQDERDFYIELARFLRPITTSHETLYPGDKVFGGHPLSSESTDDLSIHSFLLMLSSLQFSFPTPFAQFLLQCDVNTGENSFEDFKELDQSEQIERMYFRLLALFKMSGKSEPYTLDGVISIQSAYIPFYIPTEYHM